MTQPNFYLAVYQQPTPSLPKWKAEGINVSIQPAQSNNDTPQQRRAAVVASGMLYIDQPQGATEAAMIADAVSMASDSGCLYICIPDESSNNAPFYSGDPKGFQAYVTSWLATWQPIVNAIAGKKPIYGNFGGAQLSAARPWNDGSQIAPFANLCQVVSFDDYPWESYQSLVVNWNQGIGLPVAISGPGVDPLAVGTTHQQYTAKLMKQFQPNKPIWSYVQTTQYDATVGAVAPTSADILSQGNILVKEGCVGLAFFTHKFNGPGWDPAGAAGKTNWDGRTPDEVTGMDQLIKQLSIPTSVSVPIATLNQMQASITSAQSSLSSVQAILKGITG